MPSDAGADAPPPDAARQASGWRIPFWALQVLELGVAFLLVTQSVHVVHGGILAGAGVLLLALALTADGPLGIYRVCGQRLHRTLVFALVSVLVVVACIPSLRPDLEGLLVIALAMVALVVLSSRTTITGGRGRRRGGRGRGEIIDATATVAGPEPGGSSSTESDDPDTAIRKAGRTTAAAAAAGKRAVDEHRPAVEDQVKRGLRGAGRLAGRLAGPKTPPDQSA
jgi:hypothetical protein